MPPREVYVFVKPISSADQGEDVVVVDAHADGNTIVIDTLPANSVILNGLSPNNISAAASAAAAAALTTAELSLASTSVNSNLIDGAIGDSGSATSFELEVCEKCKREGEVLECDFEGCEKLWHLECVPSLRGKIPEGRWICPGPHDESCGVCGGSGEVVLCDVENCGRMYHLHCLPELRGRIPKGFWECPQCVEDREASLICAVCLKGRADLPKLGQNEELSKLVKCVNCKEAVHLQCMLEYETNGDLLCAACNFKKNALTKRRKTMQKVRLTFVPDLDPVERARIIQIARGEAFGLTDSEARAYLDTGIAKRAKKTTPSPKKASPSRN